MQKKDDGATVSNASKIKLDRTSVENARSKHKTAQKPPLQLDAVVRRWSLRFSLRVSCWYFFVGHVIRDDGCGELEEAGGGVDVVADVSGIEQ